MKLTEKSNLVLMEKENEIFIYSNKKNPLGGYDWLHVVGIINKDKNTLVHVDCFLDKINQLGNYQLISISGLYPIIKSELAEMLIEAFGERVRLDLESRKEEIHAKIAEIKKEFPFAPLKDEKQVQLVNEIFYYHENSITFDFESNLKSSIEKRVGSLFSTSDEWSVDMAYLYLYGNFKEEAFNNIQNRIEEKSYTLFNWTASEYESDYGIKEMSDALDFLNNAKTLSGNLELNDGSLLKLNGNNYLLSTNNRIFSFRVPNLDNVVSAETKSYGKYVPIKKLFKKI